MNLIDIYPANNTNLHLSADAIGCPAPDAAPKASAVQQSTVKVHKIELLFNDKIWVHFSGKITENNDFIDFHRFDFSTVLLL